MSDRNITVLSSIITIQNQFKFLLVITPLTKHINDLVQCRFTGLLSACLSNVVATEYPFEGDSIMSVHLD